MKRLLLFSLALCVFIVWALQKPSPENLEPKKVEYQKSKKNNDLGLEKSSAESNLVLPLSPNFIGGGTQFVVQNSAKEHSETPKKSFSHSDDAAPAQQGRRSGAHLDKTTPITNLSYATHAHVGEVEFTIPSGVTLPAAVVDSANNLSSPQVEVLDAIAEKFLDSAMATASSTNNTSPQTLPRSWSKSLNDANERYRSLYGVDAYNAWTSYAAKEALNESP